MASAMLATHNEPNFGDNHKVYMRQNPNPKILLPPTPNPNPNPNFVRQTNRGNLHNNDNRYHGSNQGKPHNDSSVAHNESSIDSRGYVRFDVSSCSRKEIRDLKRRLNSELDQVRSVARWIESREVSRLKSTAEMRKLHVGMMKKCNQILTRLMKHKGAIWFNLPVDVTGMGLHDYNHIIKNPMDLGTVKSKLGKGFYPSALDFAADVRLTFNNALVYNPQGHIVHGLADQLLKQFEGAFGLAYAKFEKQMKAVARKGEEKKFVNAPHPHPAVLGKPDFEAEQPEPKVGEMGTEEKERLGMALQNLPGEKLNEVLEIVRRRNVETPLDGDEVEIDFELLDDETLWELDRFVGDWNKMVNKIRKRQESGMACGQNVTRSPPSDNAINKPPLVCGGAQGAVATKKVRKGDHVDEDVDIGDERPNDGYPSIEIEKRSSYSGSGGTCSSSGGSDSGSSLGSDSEGGDGAQTPAARSRPSPRS